MPTLIALEQVLGGALGDEGIDLAKKLLAQEETDPDQRLRDRAVETHKRLASNPYLEYLGM